MPGHVMRYILLVTTQCLPFHITITITIILILILILITIIIITIHQRN